MKTLKLPIIFMLNLLNNLKLLNNKLLQRTYKYFRSLASQLKMDQEDEYNQLEQEYAEEQNAGMFFIFFYILSSMHHNQILLEEEYVDVEYIGIDEFDDSENESDDNLDNIADDEIEDFNDEDDDFNDEDDDNNDINYDELDENMDEDSSSSDDYDNLSEMDPEYAIRNFRRMHTMFMKRQQSQKKPLYSFQPLRLIQCHYKNRHDRWEYPIARSGHRIIASESHLYSLGGYNPKRPTNVMRRDTCILFQELWSYNFASNKWKLLQNADNSHMPRELASNALVIYDNVLIVSIFYSFV